MITVKEVGMMGSNFINDLVHEVFPEHATTFWGESGGWGTGHQKTLIEDPRFQAALALKLLTR